MGFRFDTPANAVKYHRVLEDAAAASGGKFAVYTHDSMPARWHFVQNERIAPVYVVPRIGYALTDRVENGSGMNKGVRALLLVSRLLPPAPDIFYSRGGDGTLTFARCSQSHGYDNAYKEMHAMFVAHGPFAAVAKASAAAVSVSALSNSSTTTAAGWHSTSDGAYVMETFENVQIYGLMMKLLGIEDRAAPTNGTRGFWDKYF